MQNQQPNREFVHITSRHSNWSAAGLNRFFREHEIYADKKAWIKFLQLLLPSTGIALTAAGIIFFFAYNWASMPPFAKLGLTGGLLILLVTGYLSKKIALLFRKLLLTAACLMAGMLLAVYGQIYQTGADSYDFYLAWSLFILIWAIASDFPPLWLIFILLVNATLYYFFEQDTMKWGVLARINVLFIANTFFLLLIQWILQIGITDQKPVWLIQTLALISIFLITVSVVIGIFEKKDIHFLIACMLLLLFYPLGFVYGLRQKSIFWIAAISFSGIAITSALILRPFDEPIYVFLLASAYILSTTTWLIIKLIAQKKRWHGIN